MKVRSSFNYARGLVSRLDAPSKVLKNRNQDPLHFQSSEQKCNDQHTHSEQGYWGIYWEKSAGFIHFFKKQYFLIWYFSLSDPITHCQVSNMLANVLRGVTTHCSGVWQLLAGFSQVCTSACSSTLSYLYNSTFVVLKLYYQNLFQPLSTIQTRITRQNTPSITTCLTHHLNQTRSIHFF